MALVTTKKMFEKAFEGGYAIGAFNINNMEIIQGVVAAAKAQNSAVILQVSKSALKYAHPKYLKAMVMPQSKKPIWILHCIWITALILKYVKTVSNTVSHLSCLTVPIWSMRKT